MQCINKLYLLFYVVGASSTHTPWGGCLTIAQDKAKCGSQFDKITLNLAVDTKKSGGERREISGWHQVEGSESIARDSQRLMPASDLLTHTTWVFSVYPITLCAQTAQNNSTVTHSSADNTSLSSWEWTPDNLCGSAGHAPHWAMNF